MGQDYFPLQIPEIMLCCSQRDWKSLRNFKSFSLGLCSLGRRQRCTETKNKFLETQVRSVSFYGHCQVSSEAADPGLSGPASPISTPFPHPQPVGGDIFPLILSGTRKSMSPPQGCRRGGTCPGGENRGNYLPY